MEQLLVHLLADYGTQSHWQAINKSKRSWPCLVHVLLYTTCFLMLTTSWKALLVIGATHFIIDRWPVLLKRLIWAKNHIGPGFLFVPYSKCSGTGNYDNLINEISHTPNQYENINGYLPNLNYITIWLYIITDNLLHLFINFIALKYL